MKKRIFIIPILLLVIFCCSFDYQYKNFRTYQQQKDFVDIVGCNGKKYYYMIAYYTELEFNNFWKERLDYIKQYQKGEANELIFYYNKRRPFPYDADVETEMLKYNENFIGGFAIMKDKSVYLFKNDTVNKILIQEKIE